jgi:hypothetical protein
MTWANGRIRTTRKGFRAVLDHSGERYLSRVYANISSAKDMAKIVATKLGWTVDWEEVNVS